MNLVRNSLNVKLSKAFTLIELLVVIALIGLLASIVFLFLANARDEARIAAGVQFDSSLRTGLGFWAVGIWHLDDGLGSPTVRDASGNGHTGTISGAVWNTACGDLGFGPCLEFDGVDDYVDVGTIDVPPNTTELTLTGWVRMNDVQDCTFTHNCRLIDKGNVAGSHPQWWGLSFAPDFGIARVRFRVKTDPGGIMTTLHSEPTRIQNGKWSFVVGTYNGSEMIIYEDGIETGRTAKSGAISIDPTKSVWIGNTPGAPRPFGGLIDEVHVYTRALTYSEVQKLYAEGVEKRKIAQE